MIEIVPYSENHKNGVDKMMEGIASEFPVSIFSKPAAVVAVPDVYWVALDDKEVVGTVAVLSRDGKYAILKKMMLKSSHRGGDKGISKLLLDTAVAWCREKGLSRIYLGTMEQFRAAQRFYEKNGFREIMESELPANFISNPVDTVFYVLEMNV